MMGWEEQHQASYVDDDLSELQNDADVCYNQLYSFEIQFTTENEEDGKNGRWEMGRIETE